MVTKYFDRNGVTSGFGTLTGTWDTTTASWTDSSLGTATPATYTFTDADQAQFGATGTSGTAGTATIAASLTVTLNGITTQNLAGLQVIAASAGGKLVFAGTDPTIDVQNDGSLRISAPIDGTKGFRLDKTSGSGYELVELTNASNPVTTADGPINVATALLTVDPTTASFNFGAARDFQLTGGWRLGDFTSNQTIAAGTTFAGTGYLETFSNGTNLVTLPAGALVGLTGTNEPAVTYLAGLTNATSGLALYLTSTTALTRNNYVDVNDLPYVLTYQSERTTTSTLLGRVRFIGTGASYPNTRIDLLARGTNSTAATLNQELHANQASGALVLGGGIKRKGNSQVQTFTLRGSNTEDNTISGAIEELDELRIVKNDAGKWCLSGTNTYTGLTTVTAGTLSARSAAALGASTGSVTVSSGATLELSGGVVVNKSGGTLTIHASDPVVSVGDNSLQVSTVPLAATTTFTVGSGNALRILNSGAISGVTFGITKAGDGELELGTGASTYSGTCTVSAGTLTVKSLNNQSANGVFGNSTNRVALTGTLKFAGSSNGSTDKVELQGSAPTLDASGTSNATATFTAFTQTNTARTLTLTGSGEGIISATLANSTQATGVTKAGTGLWRLTGAVTIGGAVAVNAGRLRVQTATSNASMTSAVTVGASGILELVTNELASSSGTAGRVIGTGNVTVSGEVKTRGGATQKGQVRYGGNLTFQAGSKLYIGGAAA